MPLLVVLPGYEPHNRKFNEYCTEECIQMIKDNKLQCKCGEDILAWDWHWENYPPCPNVKLTNDNRDVLFHPVYSSGTAAVRGSVPFKQNMHHYWEVKMISKLYGTDVMVGAATSKLDYATWKLNFCSMLGIDDNSYGYSYMGVIQHDKMRRKYGSRYGLGSIIGVHLDMCQGTMEYFLNRKPLGIAFRGLKNKDLYPMVCSTAAQSAARITCSVTQEHTLQILCLKTVMRYPTLHKKYRTISGLTRIYDREYFWITPPYEKERDEKKNLADLQDEIALSQAKRRKKRILLRRPWDADASNTDSSSSSTDEDTVPFKRLFVLAEGDRSENSSENEEFDIYKDIPVIENETQEKNSSKGSETGLNDTDQDRDSGLSDSPTTSQCEVSTCSEKRDDNI